MKEPESQKPGKKKKKKEFLNGMTLDELLRSLGKDPGAQTQDPGLYSSIILSKKDPERDPFSTGSEDPLRRLSKKSEGSEKYPYIPLFPSKREKDPVFLNSNPDPLKELEEFSRKKFPFYEDLNRPRQKDRDIIFSGKDPIKNYIKNIDYISKDKIYSFEEKNNNFIKNNIEDIILKNSKISIKKTPFSSKGLGLGLYLNRSKSSPYGEPTVSITAENVGEYVLPIVQYIAENKPDYIVASDRGARLIGLAVKKLYAKLYGKLPTVDGTLRFRRFSRSNGEKATEEYLKPLVDEMMAHKKRPKVLLLDDWICSGSTQTLAENVFSNLSNGRINLKFGVLLGRGADISGESGYTANFGGTVDWHDNAKMIGVQYSGTTPSPVRSYESMEYRQRMERSISKLAKKVVSGKYKGKPQAEPQLAAY
ncbi:Uncharacterised protein [uncultured archaeon]|nr:Uncharacterised protein [uncultured archaeon]